MSIELTIGCIMINIGSKFIILALLFLSLVANSEEIIKSHGDFGIPYDLITESYDSDITFGVDKITVLANKGTDLYTNSDGSSSKDNAPRIFFEPKSDFTFSAKVTANFTTSYDGGALFLYADKDNWGKLLFERFKTGDNGIASTVTHLMGDDAYHYLIENNEIYLKIVRKNNAFTFFYSMNGEQWSYLRSFSIVSPKAIKVGFVAQSPISQAHKVVYSNILFKE
jgi:regulation of enolase protein 1 (concanavalin A-like superfamily)